MTNDKYQKQIAQPAIIMPKNFEKERKGAEHAGRIRQALWGILRVPSFSACSAFSAEQLQPD